MFLKGLRDGGVPIKFSYEKFLTLGHGILSFLLDKEHQLPICWFKKETDQ